MASKKPVSSLMNACNRRLDCVRPSSSSASSLRIAQSLWPLAVSMHRQPCPALAKPLQPRRHIALDLFQDEVPCASSFLVQSLWQCFDLLFLLIGKDRATTGWITRSIRSAGASLPLDLAALCRRPAQ